MAYVEKSSAKAGTELILQVEIELEEFGYFLQNDKSRNLFLPQKKWITMSKTQEKGKI